MNDHDNTTTEVSDAPEDAYVQSEISLLSPASPKPIHVPQPTNIPVLDKMMDVGWNQTETHMNDPAMHNTELRPDAWRDPNEQSTGNNSPFSTGGDAAQSNQNDNTEHAANSEQTASNGVQDDPTASDASLSNGNCYEADAQVHTSDPSSLTPSNETPAVDVETAPTADAIPSESNAAEVSSQPQSTAIPTHDAPADGLSATTTLSPSHSQAQAPANATSTDSTSAQSAPALGAPPAGLPPRPPPQEQPLMNQHYMHAQNLRDYHPHASLPTAQPHARTNSLGNANAFVSPTQSHVNPANAYQTQQPLPFSTASSVPSYPHATQQQSPSMNSPVESRRDYKPAAGEMFTEDDQPWTADIQRKYDHFLDEERRYVNEARWDQFPPGSRLFVGNLSSEKVTKRDIFHVFHTYGQLAQVSIKQAYGFVQFLRPEDCARALSGEQGKQIRDKRIHLEVSKPQKASRNQQQDHRRSRSPDARNKGDRYQSNGRGGNNRGRDSRDGGYRQQYRSPSPRGGYRDRRDDRYRTRSRSPGYGRDRYSHGSPRRDLDDDLPLPRRRPHEVPEVQLICMDPLEQRFRQWVQDAFSTRGVRVDTLVISPRFPEEAVVRRQILEGVLAISKLRRHNQDMSKIGLTIFKRRGAGQDVQFEEYDNLDPHVAVELVLREKATAMAPPPPASQMSGYNAYPPRGQYQQSPPPPQYQQQQQQQQSYGGYPPQQQNSYGPPPPSAGNYPPAAYGQQQQQQPNYGGPPPPPAQHSYGGPPQHPMHAGGAPPHLPPNVNPNDLQNLLATLNPGGAAGAPTSHGGYPDAPPPPGQGVGMPGQGQGQAPPPNMQDFLSRLQKFDPQRR